MESGSRRTTPWKIPARQSPLRAAPPRRKMSPMNKPEHDPPPVQQAVLIGLGAIGTLYAARISARVPDQLRILADPARIARYQTDPPSLNGRRLNLHYVTPDRPGPPADLILTLSLLDYQSDTLFTTSIPLSGITQSYTNIMSIPASVLDGQSEWPEGMYMYRLSAVPASSPTSTIFVPS